MGIMRVLLHSYFSHNAFKVPKALEVVLCLLGNMSYQGSFIHWSQVHTQHHLHMDTDKDPYRIDWGITAYWKVYKIKYKNHSRLRQVMNKTYVPLMVIQPLTALYFGILLEFVGATLLSVGSTIYYNYRSHLDAEYTPSFLFNIWLWGEGDHMKHHGVR